MTLRKQPRTLTRHERPFTVRPALLTADKPAPIAFKTTERAKAWQHKHAMSEYRRMMLPIWRRTVKGSLYWWNWAISFISAIVRRLHHLLNSSYPTCATTAPRHSDTEWNAFPLYPAVRPMTLRAFSSGGYIVQQ